MAFNKKDAAKPAKKIPKKVVGKTKGKKPGKPKAVGLRNTLAKLFPTFAKALSIKTVGSPVASSKKKLKPLTPMTPTVNLLPEAYTVIRAVKNIRRATTIVGLGMISALGIVFYVQGAVIETAEGARSTVESQVREANAKVESFRETTDLYGLLNERKSVAIALSESVPFYYEALSAIYASLPPGAFITNLDIKYITLVATGVEGTPSGLACGPIADPFSTEDRPVSACISVQGVVSSRASISELSDSLTTSPLFSNVTVNQTVGETQGGLPFEISAGLLRDIAPGSVVLPDGSGASERQGQTSRENPNLDPNSIPAPPINDEKTGGN